MTKGFDFEFHSVSTVVDSTLEALKNGTEDVLSDDFSVEWYNDWRKDPKAVEKKLQE